MVSRAETLAWDYALRGYDAVQLASAVMLQESLGTAVRLATFDKQLWDAARRAGFEPWPGKSPQRSRESSHDCGVGFREARANLGRRVRMPARHAVAADVSDALASADVAKSRIADWVDEPAASGYSRVQ